MSYENQRADFDIWGRVYRREVYEGAPQLQPNPLAEMIKLLGKRSAEPVTYVQGDPNAIKRVDVEAAVEAVSRVMSELMDYDRVAYNCLMARHARTFEDTRGVSWARSQLPERMMARAIFDCSAETAKTKFRRACERGYMAYSRSVAA